ncbi:hypothetical protein NKH77_35295 [Streptomyces sp. M19]
MDVRAWTTEPATSAAPPIAFSCAVSAAVASAQNRIRSIVTGRVRAYDNRASARACSRSGSGNASCAAADTECASAPEVSSRMPSTSAASVSQERRRACVSTAANSRAHIGSTRPSPEHRRGRKDRADGSRD